MNRDINQVLIESGGQGSIYKREKKDGSVSAVKVFQFCKLSEALSEETMKSINRVFFICKLYSFDKESNEIEMEFLEKDSYVLLATSFNMPSILDRLRVLLQLAIFVFDSREKNFFPHSDLTPYNLLYRKDNRVTDNQDNLLRIAMEIYSSKNRRDLSLFLQAASDEYRTFFNDLRIIDHQFYVDNGFSFTTPGYEDPDTSGNSNSDIYQFGLIFYQIMTGQIDFSQLSKSIHIVDPKLSSSFDQILRGCIQEDSRRRLDHFQLLKSIAWAVIYASDKTLLFEKGDSHLLPPKPDITKDILISKSYIISLNNKLLTVQGITPPLIKGQSLYFDIKQHDSKFHVLPADVVEASSSWIDDMIAFHNWRNINSGSNVNRFFDGHLVRLKNIEFDFDRHTDHCFISIKTNQTTYFSDRRSNYFCNRFLPNSRTIYEEYGGRNLSLSDSQLSNPIALNFIVITSDNMIALCRRSDDLPSTQRDSNANLPLVPSVSGTCDILKSLIYRTFDDNCPITPHSSCLFDLYGSIQNEYNEEVIRSVSIDSSRILFLGYARTTSFHFPFIYGMIFSNKPVESISNSLPSSNGMIECQGFFTIKNDIDSIIEFILSARRVVDSDSKPLNVQDTLIFHLYRYAIWLASHTRTDAIDYLNSRLYIS